MNTKNAFHHRKLQSAFGSLLLILPLAGIPLGASAAQWSPGTLIESSFASAAPNVFAFNPSGNELWATAPDVSGGATVQVAQRTFGGQWSPLATITTIHSVAQVVLEDFSVSLSASNNAAAVWSVGGGVQIALRSPAGVWQAPVDFVQSGGASRVRAKLDANGNGVAVWARTTSAGSLVEAVTWSAAGAFGPVVQLSPSAQGAFLPDLAVNEAGTAAAVWQVAGPQDAGNPFQVESATRKAGGSWGAATAASPNVPQTWSPQVALDGAGNATVVWEQGATANNYFIFGATQRAGGSWGAPTKIEPANWYMASEPTVAADSAGNVTSSWVVENSGGGMLVRTATLAAGASWGAPVTLGQLTATGGSTNLIPPVAVARDGSISVVGWAAFAGAGSPNVAVRLGSGQWASTAIGGNPQISDVQATNNARASANWSAANGVKYHRALWQSDFP
ncbi:MAG TPA: hypothetical protein VGL42_06730 [Opitutaceae bacterium]|jgi:hypothetical protein